MKSKHLGNKILLGITILCPVVMAAPAAAQVSVGVSIGVPSPIVFVAPPQLVVLPGFDIYVAPGIAEEIYFVDGFWWRPWQGRWYRSAAYDSGWGLYSDVPYFYGSIRQDWRSDYRDHRWEGREWNYESVPYAQVQQNWSSWKSTKYWRSKEQKGGTGPKGGQHGDDRRPAASAPQQHGSQGQSPKSQHQAVAPKAAPSQHRAAPPKAASSQRHSAPSPKAAKQQQQQQGGGKPQAVKQGSQQPKSSQAKQGQDHGGGGKGNAQPSGQHGGGKGKN